MAISHCRLRKSTQLRLLEYFVLEVTARSAANLLGIQANSAILFYRKVRKVISEKLAIPFIIEKMWAQIWLQDTNEPATYFEEMVSNITNLSTSALKIKRSSAISSNCFFKNLVGENGEAGRRHRQLVALLNGCHQIVFYCSAHIV